MVVPSADQEMIHARNAIHAHAQDFVAANELLLPILKELAQYTRSLQVLEMLDIFSLSAVIDLSDAPTNSSPVAPL